MNIGKNEFCCGCNACVQSCPVSAIKMGTDRDGFLKASVKTELCIQCGKCLTVCPTDTKASMLSKTRKAYAAINKNRDELLKSSSGGVFSVLANYILEQNGVVYGCSMNKDLYVHHIRVTSKDDLDNLRRSKYVQSNTEYTYAEVKNDLKNDVKVLYSGTPCQISGLKLFLGKDYDNLFCLDLICHGVPSYKMFEADIKYLNQRYRDEADKFDFRRKSRKCAYYYYYYGKSGRIIHKPYYKDPYYEAFYNFKSYNEMCYKCPYAQEERTGDITIGDYFWALEHHIPLKEKNINLSHAISCLLINTKKGGELVKAVRNNFELYPTKMEWIIERNKNLVRPTPRPDTRNNIYNDIRKLGYEKWAKKYFCSQSYIKNLWLVRKLIQVKYLISK